jgi:hypothetical protein
MIIRNLLVSLKFDQCKSLVVNHTSLILRRYDSASVIIGKPGPTFGASAACCK